MSFPFQSAGRRTGAVGRVRAATFAAGVGLALALAPLAQAQTAMPAAPAAMPQLPSLAPLVKRVLPAVVNISVTMTAQGGHGFEGPVPNFPGSPFDEFLRRFFQQQQQQDQDDEQGDNSPMPAPHPHLQRMALGSGFIIDPSGYVVTNNHVVEHAGKVEVILQDNTRHPAKVIGRDPKTDLALLKIDVDHPLPAVGWGNSDAAQVGDWVLAVGNPFGLGGTVSSGIISARGRDIHSGPYDDFLQIDASINRGNSGGPTFDLAGRVIGINTAIYSPNGGSVGIGFAIPASLAQPVIDQLKEHGKVERGWLGVQIQQVTPEIAKSLGLPKDAGALVADVTKDGPAAKAGFHQGDVILSYDGHDIATVRDLPIAVAETPVGKTAEVKVWRAGHEDTLSPVVGAMPENPQVAQNEEEGGQPSASSSLGLHLAPLTRDWHSRLHVPESVQGVVVDRVAPNSPLAALGVQPGDVIEQINQQPVRTPKEAADKLQAVRNAKGGNKTVLLLLNRHGVNQYLALSVEGSPNG
ncbi:MAG TPA: DegQ family serine endoprotease [Stellaceae bacterium]|nr:DegQ family serine endoprotease [Stellaceae bacterium]